MHEKHHAHIHIKRNIIHGDVLESRRCKNAFSVPISLAQNALEYKTTTESLILRVDVNFKPCSCTTGTNYLIKLFKRSTWTISPRCVVRRSPLTQSLPMTAYALRHFVKAFHHLFYYFALASFLFVVFNLASKSWFCLFLDTFRHFSLGILDVRSLLNQEAGDVTWCIWENRVVRNQPMSLRSCL